MSHDAETPDEPVSALGGPGPAEVAPSVDFPVVGIGGSAGGIEAISQLLKALPPTAGMALTVIQHLSPTHASMLSEILARATKLPVTEIADETRVEPNHVYVLPSNAAVTIEGGILHLRARSTARGPARSIDTFFRSLADDVGHRAIGVVLSGSDADGTLGLQAIKAAGGITFAQDASAQHDSMPRSALASGCVDFTLAPEAIAAELTRIARHPWTAAKDAAEAARGRELPQILERLRAATDVDFTNYKRNTLLRRISRRAVLQHAESLGEYLGFLRVHPEETQALFQDILISVTSFFRNPEAFEALKATVFPRLTENRDPREAVRVWVQGCSTGEEAYSMAIAFTEHCEAAGCAIPLQVFATDLNGVGIEHARSGLYPKAIAHDVSPERLRRFFVEVDGGYRIAKAIRDRCVFAKHNVLTAPPFSNIDLASCRNLLIYLEPVLQQRLLPILHYALKPGGFLWLGASETIGPFRELFDLEDARHKIYSRKPGRGHVMVPGTLTGTQHGLRETRSSRAGPAEVGAPVPLDAQREADRVLLSRYSPPGLVVDSALEILQFRGDTTPFLKPAPGKASLNLLKMLREGLVVAVRSAVQEARKEQRAVRAAGLRVRGEAAWREVDVEVLPLGRDGGPAGTFLVVFEDAASPESAKKAVRDEPPATLPLLPGEEAARAEVRRLTQELTVTRDYLQSVILQQETANDELQSANEEVQSSNEELQSINEELETSKEEIQSSNEELATLNDELHTRNLELTQSNNDQLNLLASVQMAIVMLGPDLRIRRFTPTAEKLLNLIPGDVGRPIADIKLHIDMPDLEALLIAAMETVSTQESEVRDRLGHWYVLRTRPYRTMDNRIDGALLMLIDVDTLKQTEATLRRQAHLLEGTHEPVFMWDLETGKVSYWNRACEEVYGHARSVALGRPALELLGLPAPQVTAFRKALIEGGEWSGELVHHTRDGREVEVESRMALVRDLGGPPVVVETSRVITERKAMERALRERADQLLEMDRRRNEFLAMLAHELRNPLAPLRNSVELLKLPQAGAGEMSTARDVLDRQLGRMGRLIDDLLDAARVTSGHISFQIESVNAVEILRRAIDSVRPRAAARDQHLTAFLPEQPAWMQGDPLRLEQVFDNLLDNAIKFTAHCGNIRVSAAMERHRAKKGSPAPDQLVVSVRDDGVGMDADDLGRIFELFAQADTSLDRPRGGLGIGLTLSRRLVEHHGGTLQASSAGRGQGSEFVVRLPLSAAPTVAPATPPGQPKVPARPHRIVVVDDNSDAAESLATLLRLSGHTVEVAHDSATALAALDALRPELAILDIGMPGMDGFELAATIRRRPDSREISLIALTGYGRDDDRRRAQDSGFDEFMTKPCDFAGLLDMIGRLQVRAPRT